MKKYGQARFLHFNLTVLNLVEFLLVFFLNFAEFYPKAYSTSCWFLWTCRHYVFLQAVSRFYQKCKIENILQRLIPQRFGLVEGRNITRFTLTMEFSQNRADFSLHWANPETLINHWNVTSGQFEPASVLAHYEKTTISATLIEVYERSHTSDKQSFLIAINFMATSPVKIIAVFTVMLTASINAFQRDFSWRLVWKVPLKSMVSIPSFNADASADAWCKWTLKDPPCCRFEYSNPFNIWKLS